MGINTGRLGFLTAFMPDQLQAFIPHLQNGSYALESHLVLQALVFESKDSTTPLHSILAINEFLINKHELSGMVQIDAHIDEMYFNSYRCDGLLHISKIPQDMQPLREHFSEGMGLECIVLGSPKGKIELGFR